MTPVWDALQFQKQHFSPQRFQSLFARFDGFQVFTHDRVVQFGQLLVNLPTEKGDAPFGVGTLERPKHLLHGHALAFFRERSPCESLTLPLEWPDANRILQSAFRPPEIRPLRFPCD